MCTHLTKKMQFDLLPVLEQAMKFLFSLSIFILSIKFALQIRPPKKFYVFKAFSLLLLT